ncbi:MAG: hypothetical protein R8G66_22265 [Cytophagales bacterium]|nr:hypothetical protein [Cytophagales bacterium]
MVSTLLKTVGLYASLLPLLLGLFTFSRNHGAIRYLILLSLVACLTEFIGAYLAYHKTPNLFLFHLYPPIEFSIILTIYSLNMRSTVQPIAFLVAGVLFVLLSVANVLYIQPLHVFNTHGRGLESFLVLCLAIGYAIQQLYRPEGVKARNKPMFWINTGILIYFSTNMLLFYMSNYLIDNFSMAFNKFIWDFHAVVSFALYLFYTFAIYIDWKKAKSPVLS